MFWRFGKKVFVFYDVGPYEELRRRILLSSRGPLPLPVVAAAGAGVDDPASELPTDEVCPPQPLSAGGEKVV